MNYNAEEHRYDKIIDLPHHQSKKRRHMTMIERAAQFGAFRALTGYENRIAEASRTTEKRIELDEYECEEINRKLQYIIGSLNEKSEISVKYFVPDKTKPGGAYVTVSGVPVRIKEYEKRIVFEDGTEIPIDDILSIEGDRFDFIF